MKRLLLIVAALFLARQAQAADLSVVDYESDDHPAHILIKGPIGDKPNKLEVNQFEALAGIQKKPAIVFLDSLGGRAMIAIQIGLLIQ